MLLMLSAFQNEMMNCAMLWKSTAKADMIFKIGCEMKIAKDTVLSMRYEIFDVDGSLLDKTEEPISYLHGGYDGIFPTVEEALQGKEVGACLNVRIKPEDAFGEYEHDLVRVEPRNMFPE